VAAAVSVSGFPSDEFVFMGFPPSSGAAREQWFQTVASERRLVVFYESPHRIHRTLAELVRLGIGPMCVHRELTKINESSVIQPSMSVAEIPTIGEFTVVIAGRPSHTGDHDALPKAAETFWRMTTKASADVDEVIQLIAEARRVPVAKLRKLIKKGKIERRRMEERVP